MLSKTQQELLDHLVRLEDFAYEIFGGRREAEKLRGFVDLTRETGKALGYAFYDSEDHGWDQFRGLLFRSMEWCKQFPGDSGGEANLPDLSTQVLDFLRYLSPVLEFLREKSRAP